MGIHCSATCELMFGENGSCEGELIGEECEGMTNMFIMMNEARLYVGLQGEAQANLAYMLTEQYVKERSQFGTEIVNHPDVKKTLLKMRAMARGLRALCLYQANLFDDAKGNPEQEAEIGLLTPLVKSYCSDQGFFLASEAVQMHGGYG
jgi:alkylation response protein AidB-like acyl-CoA dehydrogenase